MDTVRFRQHESITVPPDFRQWALSNLDDGECVASYDITRDLIIFRCVSGDDWSPRYWCQMSQKEIA